MRTLNTDVLTEIRDWKTRQIKGGRWAGRIKWLGIEGTHRTSGSTIFAAFCSTFFCECTRVRPAYKSIIKMKAPLFRFTVFLFSGQNHFQWECYGHLSNRIKIALFKTLRRLDTTWSFAHGITRVSTHEHEHWEHCCVLVVFTKNKVFEQFTLAVAFVVIMLLQEGLTQLHSQKKA